MIDGMDQLRLLSNLTAGATPVERFRALALRRGAHEDDPALRRAVEALRRLESKRRQRKKLMLRSHPFSKFSSSAFAGGALNKKRKLDKLDL